MRGIIKENKVYCPNCEEHNYRITGHGLEDGHINFECRCVSCNYNFNYNYKCSNMKDKRF